MKARSQGRLQRAYSARRGAAVALLRAGVVLLGLTVCDAPLRADEANDASPASIADMDLEGLVRVRIQIASIDAKPVEAQPAVVTVITAKEIEDSGAKDLKDILQLVPGFTAGTDVCGVVGPGFRGIWAYEGKVQVLVDGVEMNDGNFGNVFTLDRFAAANIKQVEILRGPGSARYGGTAEMAVISVTSKGAELDGGFVSERLYFHRGEFSHQVASSVGYRLTGDLALHGNVAYGEFAPSDRRYVSPDGAVARDLHGNQLNRPVELNLSLGSKDAEVRVMYYRYQARDQIFYGQGTAVVPQGQPGDTETSTFAVSAKRHFKISERLSSTPRAVYRFEKPWEVTYNGTQDATHRRYQRFDLDVPASIRVGDSSSMVLGVRYYREHDRAVLISGTNLNFPGQTVDNYFSGSDHIAHDDVAAYAQYDLDSTWVNLTVGGRYEYYSYSGAAFVPRVGLVRAWDRFHVKALYSESFRTPNIGVVNDSPIRLKDEFTTTYEVEAGVRLGGGLSLTGNVYRVRIRNLIGFEPSINRYRNGAPMSTEGVELQARLDLERLTAHLGYSYNRAVTQGFALYSAQPTLGRLNLNMPAHQLVWSATWQVAGALSWNASGTFLSRRAAYAYPDPTAPSVLDAEVLLHTFLNVRWRQLDLGLGVRDLFDQREVIGQPYNGGTGPLRLSGRTFFAQIGFRFQDER